MKASGAQNDHMLQKVFARKGGKSNRDLKDKHELFQDKNSSLEVTTFELKFPHE